MDVTYYDGEHSVTFGEKNSWTDWHMIPSSRPVVNPPSVKTKYITMPGSNRIIDLTEILTGRPVFDYREGSIEFIVVPGYDSWSDLYSEIMNYLHGQSLKMYLSDDPAYYYEGRFSVNAWKSSEHYSTITIDYYVYPYKQELTSSTEPWLWDPFSFEYGVIRDYSSLTVSGSLTVTIDGSDQPVTPVITVSAAMTLTVDGTSYSLTAGTNTLWDLTLGSGTYSFVFTGTGTVTIEYRGGSL